MNHARLLVLSKPQRPPAAILSQFANGEKGGIWLPHFTKSMFQDAAMTIPAAVGMPVVKMLDLSGNGNTITFANVTLQRDTAGKLYLAANGTTSYGSTAAIDLTGTDKLFFCAGVRKAAASGMNILAELSADSGANNGAFYVAAPVSTAAESYGFSLRGTVQALFTATTYTAPVTHVVACSFDISQATREAEILPRVNGATPGTLTGAGGVESGTGNFGNHPLFLFMRNAAISPFSGSFHGLVLRGAANTAGQIADAERIMAGYTGVNF